MTQEEKDLLLKDLCGRLPYGIKCSFDNKVFSIDYISAIYEEIKLDSRDDYTLIISDVKPYLLPLSSMTEEQRKEYEGIIYKYIELHCERYYDVIDIDDFENLEDFYYKHHLDYRGLIRMDLAYDATGLNIY